MNMMYECANCKLSCDSTHMRSGDPYCDRCMQVLRSQPPYLNRRVNATVGTELTYMRQKIEKLAAEVTRLKNVEQQNLKCIRNLADALVEACRK